MSIFRSGEMLPKIVNRSGATFGREENRLGLDDREEPRNACGSSSEGVRLLERLEPRTG
jgi:hypothetical protein